MYDVQTWTLGAVLMRTLEVTGSNNAHRDAQRTHHPVLIRGTAMKPLQRAILIPILASLAACDSFSEAEKCAADKNCAAAMDTVDNAQIAVKSACPKNESLSTPACDAARTALESAQQVEQQLQPK